MVAIINQGGQGGQMKRVLCFVCMILLSTVAFGQDLVKPGFTDVNPQSLADDIIKEAMEGNLESRTQPITSALAAFPMEIRPRLAFVLAQELGLFSYINRNGCAVVFDEESSMENYINAEKLAKVYEYCWIDICVTSGASGTFSPNCTTNCDTDNFYLVCWWDDMACCGCIRPSVPWLMSRGCGGCRPWIH